MEFLLINCLTWIGQYNSHGKVFRTIVADNGAISPTSNRVIKI